MRNVKVFLASHYDMPSLVKALNQYGIKIYQDKSECDTALVLFGDYVNPMAFKGKKVMAHRVASMNYRVWELTFFSMVMPVLKHYYDEFIDMSKCSTMIDMGNMIANEVKRLENE